MILIFSVACPAGTYGKSCKNSCENDQYGTMCNSTCQCSSVQVCHNIFGCVCSAGLTGIKCDKGNVWNSILNFKTCTVLLQSFVKNIKQLNLMLTLQLANSDWN